MQYTNDLITQKSWKVNNVICDVILVWELLHSNKQTPSVV